MSKKQELTYASAMQELEQIVARLQDPACDVDQLTVLTARSVELLRYCREHLTKTDTELVKLLEELD